MLKMQDLLVTLKILSFEDGIDQRDRFHHWALQGKAWLHHDIKGSQYDKDRDEIVGADEIDDFKQSDLNAIEQFLYQTEPESDKWTYRKLAEQLFISLGETNKAVKRAVAAGLLMRTGRRDVRVNRPVLINFIRYGAGVSFFVEKGRIVRGIPTAYAAPVFDDLFAGSSEYPPVWPCARGTVRGVAISPLHKSVTKAVMIDPWLYQQLAIVDIFRIGSARERENALPCLNELKGV